MNDNSMYNFLTVLSVVLQMETLKTVSNDELMEELQRQDRKYLETIIEKQNKILSILESMST